MSIAKLDVSESKTPSSYNVHLPNPDNLLKAARLIQSDEVVSFPTETVYGLGANALSTAGVGKIYELKQRPPSNPLILHLPNLDWIERVAVLQSDKLRSRVEKISTLWPGPITIIVPKHPSVPSITTAGKSSVALRIPSHPIALKLLEYADRPIAAPSANLSTHVSPTSAMHVYEEFGRLVPMILDGGPCPIGLESTILSLVANTPTLLRPGALSVEQLEDTLGEPLLVRTRTSPGAPTNPGQAAVHYAPKTPIIFECDVSLDRIPARTALITFSRRRTSPAYREVRILSENGNLEEVAHKLFATIRELDKRGFNLLVVDSCSQESIGAAIMDRLKRATARQVAKKETHRYRGRQPLRKTVTPS